MTSYKECNLTLIKPHYFSTCNTTPCFRIYRHCVDPTCVGCQWHSIHYHSCAHILFPDPSLCSVITCPSHFCSTKSLEASGLHTLQDGKTRMMQGCVLSCRQDWDLDKCVDIVEIPKTSLKCSLPALMKRGWLAGEWIGRRRAANFPFSQLPPSHPWI